MTVDIGRVPLHHAGARLGERYKAIVKGVEGIEDTAVEGLDRVKVVVEATVRVDRVGALEGGGLENDRRTALAVDRTAAVEVEMAALWVTRTSLRAHRRDKDEELDQRRGHKVKSREDANQ